jgi:hypothetical protein
MQSILTSDMNVSADDAAELIKIFEKFRDSIVRSIIDEKIKE